MNTKAEMVAFGASELACAKWPADTPEHRVARVAYCEGAHDAAASRPDPAELKRLIENVKTCWYGFAIGTHSGIDAVTASAALYKTLEIEP